MEDYDFKIADSVYKILDQMMDYKSAEEVCQDTLEGGGWVFSLTSQHELDQLTTELVIRHEGEQLEYWLYQNTTSNITSNLEAQTPQPGRKVQTKTSQFRNDL